MSNIPEVNCVDLEIRDKIAFITINRPEAMNALNEAVVNQLNKHFTDAVSRPDVQAIVIQGAGKPFVAGADIRFFVDKIKAQRIPEIAAFTRKGHELLFRIENSPKQTIALLDGLSLGGGSELALACQKILATPDGILGFPETGIGIFPGLGGMLRFAKNVGAPLAKYYTFTGLFINAEEAHQLGIVSKLVPATEVPEALKAMVAEGKVEKYQKRAIPAKFQELAALFEGENKVKMLSGQTPSGAPPEVTAKILKTIGFKAPIALKMADEIIDAQEKASIQKGIEIELGYLEKIFSTADALEGLQSTLEKRRPSFKGV
jgi:enoyl-CoA hydratase / 3-hydroxyacyl-CoA dehydrogenase